MLNNLLSLGEPIVLAHIGEKGLCDQPPMKTLKMSCLMGFPGQRPHTRPGGGCAVWPSWEGGSIGSLQVDPSDSAFFLL